MRFFSTAKKFFEYTSQTGNLPGASYVIGSLIQTSATHATQYFNSLKIKEESKNTEEKNDKEQTALSSAGPKR